MAFLAHTLFYLGSDNWLFWVIKYTVPENHRLKPLSSTFGGFRFGAFAIPNKPGGIGLYPIAVSQCFSNFWHQQHFGLAFGWSCGFHKH